MGTPTHAVLTINKRTSMSASLTSVARCKETPTGTNAPALRPLFQQLFHISGTQFTRKLFDFSFSCCLSRAIVCASVAIAKRRAEAEIARFAEKAKTGSPSAGKLRWWREEPREEGTDALMSLGRWQPDGIAKQTSTHKNKRPMRHERSATAQHLDARAVHLVPCHCGCAYVFLLLPLSLTLMSMSCATVACNTFCLEVSWSSPAMIVSSRR
jgi:hypothetical protein